MLGMITMIPLTSPKYKGTFSKLGTKKNSRNESAYLFSHKNEEKARCRHPQ